MWGGVVLAESFPLTVVFTTWHLDPRAAASSYKIGVSSWRAECTVGKRVH